MSNETIAVKWPDGPYEYKLIDKDDYDPEVHELHEVSEVTVEVVAEQNPEVTTEQEEPGVVEEAQEAAPANRKGKRN